MIKPSQLSIGTELYQYSNQIITYEIIGVNELKTKEHVEKFYILKCLSCSDHSPCEIAVKFDNYGNLEYSHMINQYDEYDEENERCKNSQYYWHKNKEYNWFLTRKEARKYIHNKNIKFYNEEIQNLQNRIQDLNKKILDSEDKIKALDNE
jgi:hypothetical protein